MDGRAPDTIARLKEKSRRKKRTAVERKATTPLDPPAEFQRSYRWRSNSCWLDSSLTVLFAATSRDFPMIQKSLAALPLGHILHQLSEILAKHVEQAALPGFESGGCRILTTMRDELRKALVNANCVQGMGSSDAMFVSTFAGVVEQLPDAFIGMVAANSGELDCTSTGARYCDQKLHILLPSVCSPCQEMSRM
jgi:hypothetical protein